MDNFTVHWILHTRLGCSYSAAHLGLLPHPLWTRPVGLEPPNTAPHRSTYPPIWKIRASRAYIRHRPRG